MKKRVAIYLRISTSKQDTDNQLRELSAVADRSGWEIWKVYEDAGISGAKGRDTAVLSTTVTTASITKPAAGMIVSVVAPRARLCASQAVRACRPALKRNLRGSRRYCLEWRAPLPRRKSTKPPAKACGREMILPTCSLNCSCNAAGPARYLL